MPYDLGMFVADTLFAAMTIVAVVVSLLALRKDKGDACV